MVVNFWTINHRRNHIGYHWVRFSDTNAPRYTLVFFQIGDGMNDIWMTISGVIATVGSVLVRSLVLVAVVFQYYNLVERREGSGIISAIDNIGKPDSPRTNQREEEF
jgi:hypothetical protein